MNVLFEVRHYMEPDGRKTVYRTFDVVARRSDILAFSNVLVNTYGMGAELRRPIYKVSDEFWVAEVRVVRAYYKHIMSIVHDLAMAQDKPAPHNLFKVTEKTTGTKDLPQLSVIAPSEAIDHLSRLIHERGMTPHLAITEDYDKGSERLIGISVRAIYRQALESIMEEVNTHYEAKTKSET